MLPTPTNPCYTIDGYHAITETYVRAVAYNVAARIFAKNTFYRKKGQNQYVWNCRIYR